MIYVSWAALYEGATDQAYFDVLLPRLMEDVVVRKGVRAVTVPIGPAIRFKQRTVEAAAAEVCGAQDAFHILFVHADSGGRNLETDLPNRSTAYCEAINALCAWPRIRCVVVSPRHETEAWILADPTAVIAALGFNGPASKVGLPANAKQAEKLVDPKATLADAIGAIRGRRGSANLNQVLPAIAQRQALNSLRQSASFMAFEGHLAEALADIGCIEL